MNDIFYEKIDDYGNNTSHHCRISDLTYFVCEYDTKFTLDDSLKIYYDIVKEYCKRLNDYSENEKDHYGNIVLDSFEQICSNHKNELHPKSFSLSDIIDSI